MYLLLLRTILNPATKQIHVRAQFDYNPLEDEFIPCAQAGVAFKIGDILQVILLRWNKKKKKQKKQTVKHNVLWNIGP